MSLTDLVPLLEAAGWWLFTHALYVALSIATYITVAFLLSQYDVCFTQIKEGTAKTVVRGSSFDHIIMRWQGHYLNDPRKLSFDHTIAPWEVLSCSNSNLCPSAYAWWQLHWKILEWIGVYWFGLFPFKQVYTYEFRWTEHTIDNNGDLRPWHRDENTDYINVKNFAYWIKLLAAEDEDNEPLDLDYLLTIHINNPFKALFAIDDWLGRITADANNDAKIYVGYNKFDNIKRECESKDATTSEFATRMLALNNNLITEPGVQGAKVSYGVTINAASLVDANPAGVSKDDIIKSFSARIIAQRNAEAAVETAKGEGNAAKARAEGTAEAARIAAKGQADAIKTVYDQVATYGDTGIALQQLDAIRQASQSPGSTVIWAADPIGGMMAAVRAATGRSSAQPQTPPSNNSES